MKRSTLVLAGLCYVALGLGLQVAAIPAIPVWTTAHRLAGTGMGLTLVGGVAIGLAAIGYQLTKGPE